MIQNDMQKLHGLAPSKIPTASKGPGDVVAAKNRRPRGAAAAPAPAASASSVEGSGRPVRVVAAKPAGPDHQVVSIISGRSGSYRRSPCGGCPWVRENAGSFPPEAFVHSASTAYDLAQSRFACHESGQNRPATCAGFLLRGAGHNLAVRLDQLKGERFEGLEEGSRPLFDNYRAMAEANGVAHDEPALKPCR